MRNSLVALGVGTGLVGVLLIGGVVAASGDRPPDLGERIVVPSVTTTPSDPAETPTSTTRPRTTVEPSPKPTPTPTPTDSGGRQVPPPTPPGSDDDADDRGDDANDDDADD
jgi:hypothetical protein